MPVVTMIAGPNGSGKSTLINLLIERGVTLGAYANADDIAKNLVGKPQETAARAQQMVRNARAEALALGRDHSFETVMSHSSHIDHLIAARKQGFTTRLFFVATDDPRINLARVQNRVIHGGHNVPADRVVARYHRCLANLPAAVAASDEGIVFDNSNAENPFRNLAHIESGILHPLQLRSDGIVDLRANLETLPEWWLRFLASQQIHIG